MSDERTTNGSAQDRKRTPADWRTWALVLLAGALVFSFVSSCQAGDAAENAQRAVDDVELLEKRNSDSSRATAYRLCSRNKNDRAYAHARERGLPIKGLPPGPPMGATERRIRKKVSRGLMETSLLAILDCRPNLTGLGAKPLPVSKPPKGCEKATIRGRCATQEEYVHGWRKGKLTNEELGICPKSRIGVQSQAHRC